MHRLPNPRQVLGLCAALIVAACARPTPPIVRPVPEPTVVERLPQGATLAVARPTPGVAQLSLWLEVGSRHASPPQLATAAAWWAAEAAGAHARVLPEGTEITLACNTLRDGIARCVQKLGNVLRAKAPTAEQARTLRLRLRASRLRALGDHERQTSLAALETLFGEEARALEPLGRDEDDGAVTPEHVQAFLAAYYRKRHAVLMAAGDVGEKDLASAFAGLSDAPTRASDTPPRPAKLEPKGGLTVTAGPAPLVAFALAAPSVPEALAIAHRFREIHTTASARVSPLRSVAVLHVTLPLGSEPSKRLQSAVFDVRRLALEPMAAPVAVRSDESLEGVLSELGQSWAARGATRRELAMHWPLGVAVTMPDDTAPDSPEAKRRLQRWREDAALAISLAEANAEGRVRGDIDRWGARVLASNGARIEVQRRPGERWFAAAVRFDAGSAADPLTRHGRAALLATLMADGCGFASGPALDARLISLDARIVPLVTPDAVGIAITAPTERTEAALDVLMRCAVRPALTQRGLEDARVRLLSELRTRPDALFAAYLGRALTPSAPGTIAPWGTPLAVSAISLGEVRRLHAELLRGARMRVFVAADRDPTVISRFVARRLGHLEAGERAAPMPDPDPPAALHGELTDVPSLHAVMGLRTPSTTRTALAPQVLARAWLEAVCARLGRPVWAWGASSDRVAGAGLAIALTEDELTRLEPTVREVLRDLAARSDASWTSALEAAQTERAKDLASSLGWVRASFAETASAPQAIASELALLRRLVLETPSYVLLRPRP